MRAAAPLLALLTACGDPSSHRALDLCARGDRVLLEAALDGGRLDVRVEQDGDVVSMGSLAGTGAGSLDIDLPDGDATVVIEGYDDGGALVARGEGALAGDGGCACLALDAQAAAACGGVTCQVVADTCRFTDAATGASAGRQQISLAPAADTWLDDAAPAEAHGDDDTLQVAAGETALLRFDLAGLPAAATIENAELVLVRADASSERPTLHRVIAAWDDDTTAADDPPLDDATIAPDGGGGDQLVWDITGDVARWVSAPADNANDGVGLTLTSGAAAFASSEAADAARPVLRIDYSVEAMSVLPAGVLERGCPSTCDPDEETGDVDGCGCDEQPVHQVELGEFEINRTEVTQSAYQACVNRGACDAPADAGECVFDPDRRPNFPATCITWSEARDYCAFAGKRLPTEAEWERAADGSSAGRYPWGDDMPTCALANSYFCSPGNPAAAARDGVGRRPDGASLEGADEIALDMAGNAFEWVADFYDAGIYAELAGAAEPPLDPAGPDTGDERVRRGGFYYSGEWLLRSGSRDHRPPGARDPGTGFRCAR